MGQARKDLILNPIQNVDNYKGLVKKIYFYFYFYLIEIVFVAESDDKPFCEIA